MRVTLRPVPVAGGVMGEVNRVANETRKGLDAAGRSITSATVAASRATMDGARFAGRAIGEVGKNIAGAGEWIGASVTSVASNLASSGDRPGRGDGKEDEHRVIHRGEPGATVATRRRALRRRLLLLLLRRRRRRFSRASARRLDRPSRPPRRINRPDRRTRPIRARRRCRRRRSLSTDRRSSRTCRR